MPRNYWGEIKDPVHGYVYITAQEKRTPFTDTST